MKDYYAILGVSASDRQETIKEKYRELARKWHPDLNQENIELAEANMKLINEAYDILVNREKKRKYDLERMEIARLAWRIVPSWSASWGMSTDTNTGNCWDLVSGLVGIIRDNLVLFQ